MSIPAPHPTPPHSTLNGHHQSAAGSQQSQRATWARTESPLRIAILGWARLAAQQWEGSGYNLSASELARGLKLSGHDVIYLGSGMIYRIFVGCAIRHREDWAGIPCFDVRNSPNLSPSAHNFKNMEMEIACPSLSRVVLKWLDEHRVDVVHIHSLEGYGLDLIGAIEDSGRPVVVTPHNYTYICPQVDLLYKERQVCFDYDGGLKCETCLPAMKPAAARRQRALHQTLVTRLGHYRVDAFRRLLSGVVPTLKQVMTGRLLRPLPQIKPTPERLTDPETALGYEHASNDDQGPSKGEIPHDLPLAAAERPRPFGKAPADANERFLESSTIHLKVLNEYGRRRVAGIAALGRASLVTPPSDFLRRAHVALGVPEDRTRWVRLGQPHFDQINRRTRRSPFYHVSPWDPRGATRPLRFAFLGTVRPNKGLEVLTRAIPLLDRDVRQRCQFLIRAQGWDWPFRKRLARFPEVSVWGGYDIFQLIAAGGEFDIAILPHIWFENSPLVMLESFHAGKFILASRLGGPPDWIDEPRNGLLFPAGDPQALAERITQLVTGDVRVPSPKEIHESTVLQSYPAHVREVESIYREVLASKHEPRPPISMRPVHLNGTSTAPTSAARASG